MSIPHITVFVFITLIASFSLSQVYAEPIVLDSDFIVEKFVSGLEYPTSMDFVGDDILVLEQYTGKVIRIQANGIMHNEPVLDVPVRHNFYSGLLGIATTHDHVFLYYTESESGSDSVEDGTNAKNSIYQYDWNGERLINPVLIKELMAAEQNDHHGGAMTMGQNGEIYFVIGDQGQSGIFQNNPGGTIDETGSIFKIDTENNNAVELFAMGIRNSFGLAVDPVTGYLWDTENGPDYFDEINLVKPGFNSGWEVAMGPMSIQDKDSIIAVGNSQILTQPFENFEYSDPEFSWHTTVGPTAIAFPNLAGFERYSDSLFVGDFHNGRIYNFQLNSDRTGFVFSNPELSDLLLMGGDNMDEILFASDFPGVTDVTFHDGAMYVVSIGDGSIYKVYPKKPLSPLKQYQNGVTHKKIVCKTELMPIMSKSGYVYCVQPKTAITLNNVLNWSINHPEMPKIELRYQYFQGLNFEYTDLSNSDFKSANFDDTAKISNANFTRANLSYSDLSGKDLTGTVLTGANLSYANLTDVDLTGKDLTGTVLIGADLTGIDVTGTILVGADLSDANLADVDLSGKDLTGTVLTGAELSGKDLTGTILIGADLTDADLEYVDLSGKDLTGTILVGADLTGVNFTDVDLSGKDMAGVTLTGVDLSGKDLTGTILTGINLSNKDFTGTILVGADLSDTTLTNVDLSGKDLTGTRLVRADLTNAILADVILSGADLTGTLLAGIDLAGKDLTGTILTGINLSNKDFTGTILVEADLSYTTLTNVDLSGVDLTGASLVGVDLSIKNFTGTSLTGADLSNTILAGVDLTGMDLTGASLVGVDLFQKDLTGTILIGADLTDAFMDNVIFRNVNLENVTLENVRLIDADLTNTNLTNANLRNSILADANLTNAILREADLTNAVLSGANLHGANLENAILTGTILNCKNHPICED